MTISALTLLAVAALMGSIKPVAEVPPRQRKFETLFDGDEIEGKHYELGEPVTGLDAPTATYLVQIGRIAEIDDARFVELGGELVDEADAEPATDPKAEARAKALEAAIATAKAAFDKGEVPTDLLNPDAAADATDKLIARAKLDEIAAAAGAEVKSGMSKADVAVAIMAARALASS